MGLAIIGVPRLIGKAETWWGMVEGAFLLGSLFSLFFWAGRGMERWMMDEPQARRVIWLLVWVALLGDWFFS